MEIPFTAHTEARLSHLAHESGSDVRNFVQRLVEDSLEEQACFIRAVQVGIGQMDRGETITGEEVGERLERLYRS